MSFVRDIAGSVIKPFIGLFHSEDSQGSVNAAPTSSDHHPPTSTRKRPRSSPEHVTRVTTRNSSQRAFMKNSDSSAAQNNTNQFTRNRRFQRQPDPTSALEVISDSDNDEPPAKRSRKSTPTRGLNPLTDRRRHSVDRPPPEESHREARLLGGHSGREADEITIDEPGSKHMMVQKKPQIGGGFRPQSTLNQPKQTSNSSKSKFFDEKVRPSTVKLVKEVSTTNSNGRMSAEAHPNKRRKTSTLDFEATNRALRETTRAAQSSSPAHPTASGLTQEDAISLDDSQPAGERRSSDRKTVHRLNDSHARQRKADSSPLRKFEPLTNPTNGTSLGLTRSGAVLRTQPSLQDSGHSVGGAPANMLNDSVMDDDVPTVVPSRPHSQARRSSPEASDQVHHVPTAKANKPSHRRPATRGTEEHTSPHTRIKHINVPPESPDELHADDDDALHQPIKPPQSLQRDMNELTPNRNRLLADSIEGNPNSTKLSKHRRAAKSTSERGLRTFLVKDIVASGIVRRQDYYELRIEPNGDLCILPRDSQLLDDEPMLLPRRASDVQEVHQDAENGKFVQLGFRGDKGHKTKYSLQLPSQKVCYDLITALQSYDANIRIRDRTATWMESAFEKHEQDIQYIHASTGRREHAVRDTNDISRHFQPAANAKRRTLLKDKLDTPEVKEDSRGQTVITGRDRRGVKSASPEALLLPPDSARATRSDSTVQPSVESPEIFTERSTRSRPQRSSRAAPVYTLKTPPPRVKFSQTGGLGDPWKNPLLYPPDAKKKESVDWGSLERLDDEEFLNDTLVGFFLRYVHYQVEKTNPELIKKMHFFNSYFFDSLTRNVKNRKEINYQSVAKWTKNINLFHRDFIVVPINEHLHWFLVIICNLSHFVPKPEDEGGDTDELDERPLPATDGPGSDQAEHETRQSFEELSIHDPDSHAARQVNSPNKAGKKGNKNKKRPSLQKYDTKTPIIISLDSLGQARSGTCGYLKQYVVQEAKNKLKIDIDEKDIRAMTAKEIPTQGNFSDCGLYVCMYLEQFMRNPNKFIQAILQREPFPWPRSIQSDELRSRLRNLIMELHREQENEEGRVPIPELGRIMVDMRETTDEPEPEVKVLEAAPSTPPGVRETRQRLESHMKGREKIDTPLKATDDNLRERRTGDSSGVKPGAKAHVSPPVDHEAIMIEDDPESPEVKTATQPKQDTPDLSNHESPQQLAIKLREARGDQAEEQNGPESRANSVSTEYLLQGGNYKLKQEEDGTGALTATAAANGEQNETVQQINTVVDSQDSAEIPETQEEAEEPLPEVELHGGSQSRAAEDEIIVQ